MQAPSVLGRVRAAGSHVREIERKLGTVTPGKTTLRRGTRAPSQACPIAILSLHRAGTPHPPVRGPRTWLPGPRQSNAACVRRSDRKVFARVVPCKLL